MASTTRTLLQATYAPIKLPEVENIKYSESNAPETAAERGVEKAALLRFLAPTEAEHKALSRDNPEISQPVKKLSSFASLAPMNKVAEAANIDFSAILKFADALVTLRQKHLKELRENSKEIVKAAHTLHRANAPSAHGAIIKENESLSTKVSDLGESLRINIHKIDIIGFLSAAEKAIHTQAMIVNSASEAVKVEPVGYLHLERLAFTPAGTERGELVHSIPLSPGEEVNITHREWSKTSEEFESIINDYLEEFSEEGVTEKSELSDSVNTQNQHSTAFNTGVTASGGYGGVTITTSFGYSANDSSTRSAAHARNHSSSITQKSSSRAKREHKVSFRVASASEIENQQVQRIKNPYDRIPARVDYYQIIRKWQVDLFRYGVRLTWDLTIPEPGSALLSKMREIDSIRAELENGFENVFTLTPNQLTRAEYAVRAAEYGVAVEEAPPPDEKVAIFTDSRSGLSRDKYLFEFVVPADYTVHSAQLDYMENHQSGSWGIQIQDASGPHYNLFSKGSSWGSTEVNNYTG